MAFHPSKNPKERITALLESLSSKRIEVNMIRFSGPDLDHLDNRLMSLELVHQGLTEAVLFGTNHTVLHASDSLYHKQLFVLRGTFRPVTNTNLEVLTKGLAQFKKHPLYDGKETETLFEITMNNLARTGEIDNEDFLHRVDTLNTLGYKVLISKFYLFYQMKSFLRLCTNELIGISAGASLLEKMFEPSFYKSLPGGMLEGFSRLFDEKTHLFVHPFQSEKGLMTAQTFKPEPKISHLYQHVLANDFITDVQGCEKVDTSIHSEDVRVMLSQGSKKWKDLVPKAARELIESRQLFGYKP